jgi:hypothetical protein
MLAVFVAELAPTGLQWITAACFPRRPLKDRPLLGALTGLPAFPYEPVNEIGHDPGQCDLIVCWQHNWKNCPPNLQVLELSRIVAEISKPCRG